MERLEAEHGPRAPDDHVIELLYGELAAIFELSGPKTQNTRRFTGGGSVALALTVRTQLFVSRVQSYSFLYVCFVVCGRGIWTLANFL